MSGKEYVDKLRSTRLYSVHGRLLRFDRVMVWKSFHSDVDLGFESLFEGARDVGTRGHRFNLAISGADQRLKEGPFS